MNDRLVRDKIFVFISSNIDPKYNLVRKALYDLLMETGLCRVYEFNEEPGVSEKLVSDYLMKVEMSDIVIVLIVNGEEIKAGTLKEINLARKKGKKMIYVFCDEKEKGPTQFQKELHDLPDAPKYVTVSKMEDMAYKAYESAICDITDRYKAYCRGYYIKTNDDYIDNEKSDFSYKDDVVYSRTELRGNELEKIALKRAIGIVWGNPPSEESNVFVAFLNYILGFEKLGAIDFTTLKKAVIDKARKKFHGIVEKRMEAFEAFFQTDYKKAFEILSQCAEEVKQNKSIPEWMRNDIAIDLRNVQIKYNEVLGERSREFVGQKIIDDSEEVLYYPILDRLNSDFYESLSEEIIGNEQGINRPVNYLSAACDKLVGIFSIALSYGSITHVLVTRKRLYTFLTSEYIRTRNHSLFVFAVKLMILAGDDKALFALCKMSNEMSDLDAKSVLEMANDINDEYMKVEAYAYILNLFGYCFDDYSFKLFEEEFWPLFTKAIKKAIWNDFLIRRIVDAIISCKERIDNGRMAELYLKIFDGKFHGWTINTFQLLDAIDIENLDKKNQEYIANSVIKAIQNKEIRENCHKLQETIAILAKKSQDVAKIIEPILSREMADYYKSFYKVEMDVFQKKNVWLHIKEQLEIVSKQNEERQSGVPFESSTDVSFRTIWNTLEWTEFKPGSENIKALIASIKNTLEGERQTYNAKSEAFSVLIMMLARTPKSKSIKDFVKYLDEEMECITGNENYSKRGFGAAILLMQFGFLKSFAFGNGLHELMYSLPNIAQDDVYTQYNALRMIKDYVALYGAEKIPKEISESLVQFLLTTSNHSDGIVRFWAIETMGYFIHSSWRDLIVARLSNMMDFDRSDNKTRIIKIISKEPKDIQTEYILNKGLADSNYLVREAAKRARKA